ncbi:capsid assembly protein [Labrys neptuniae]
MTDTTLTPAITPAPTAPAEGTPEHDAAMAAKFDAAQKPEGVTETKPEVAPEVKPEVKPEGQTEEKKPEGTENQTETEKAQADAANALKEVGLAYDKYEAEYRQNGKLSDATYAEMAAKNIPRAVVDAHINGLVSTAEREAEAIRTDIFQSVGGEEKFASMVQWASTNVPRADLLAFNQIVDSGNVGQVKLAVKAMMARHEAEIGKEPNLLDVSGGRAQAGDVYRSTAQLVADMADPRYERDPAFRADVEAKLSRSNIM